MRHDQKQWGERQLFAWKATFEAGVPRIRHDADGFKELRLTRKANMDAFEKPAWYLASSILSLKAEQGKSLPGRAGYRRVF